MEQTRRHRVCAQPSVLTALLLWLLACMWTTSALPIHLSDDAHAPSKTGVVRVILLGATGNLASKYLWVANFRLALEAHELRRQEYRFIAAASDTQLRGDQWKSRFFDAAFLGRVCGNNSPPPQSEIGDSLAFDKCATFFHNHFVPRIRYARLREEAHYQQVAQLLAEENDSMRRSSKVEVGRLVYLAIPPTFFAQVSTVSECGYEDPGAKHQHSQNHAPFAFYEQSSELVHKYFRPQAPTDPLGSSSPPYLRVIIEKPFGADSDSALELKDRLHAFLEEDEIYLIDHYAGKAAVQAFGDYLERNHRQLHPRWNSKHITKMEVRMTETESCEGRIGYFHSAGIIRDVMVNHLQLLLGSAVAPAFRVLQQTDLDRLHTLQRLGFTQSLQRAPTSRVLLGQYDSYASHYKQETGQELFSDGGATVKVGSGFVPTAARIELQSSADNWKGTQFVLSAAKATHERRLDMRVQFATDTVEGTNEEMSTCDLRVTIQTRKNEESRKSQRIEWSCDFLDGAEPPTDWEYSAEDPSRRTIVPSSTSTRGSQMWERGDEETAYDALLHEAALGNQRHFASMDEALASWKLWTPIVRQAEAATRAASEPQQTLHQPPSFAIYPTGKSVSWLTAAVEPETRLTTPHHASPGNDEL